MVFTCVKFKDLQKRPAGWSAILGLICGLECYVFGRPAGWSAMFLDDLRAEVLCFSVDNYPVAGWSAMFWRSDGHACGYLDGAGRRKQLLRDGGKGLLRSGIGLLHLLHKAEIGIERIGDVNNLVAQSPFFRLLP